MAIKLPTLGTILFLGVCYLGYQQFRDRLKDAKVEATEQGSNKKGTDKPSLTEEIRGEVRKYLDSGHAQTKKASLKICQDKCKVRRSKCASYEGDGRLACISLSEDCLNGCDNSLKPAPSRR